MQFETQCVIKWNGTKQLQEETNCISYLNQQRMEKSLK
jgi:hypothetical protein